MLVRTPAPFPTESLLGYVLRISETNGYDTPWHILKLAGIDQSQMTTASFPVGKFAAIVNRHPEALAHIEYWAQGTQNGGFRLLGHDLGRGAKINPFRLRRPALCPECVEKNGYIDAFFDLRLAVACPTHRRPVVRACPACGDHLRWFRSGLLTCRCGAALGANDLATVSDAVGDLMAVLMAKVHNQPADALALATSIPAAKLLEMPLRSLLVKLQVFARISGRAREDNNPEVIIDSAAEAFADWPRGFHRFIESVGQSRPAKGIGFRKRFEDVFGALFKDTAARNGLPWLREQFVLYGLAHASDAVVDDKMLAGQRLQRRYVTKRELARRLGVSPITLRKWSERGLVAIKCVEAARQVRYVADADNPDFAHVHDAEGAVLEARAAAAYIQLPVSVLRNLKATGAYPSLHRFKHKGGYHQADLEAFRSRLLANSPSVDLSQLDTLQPVSLSEVMGNYRFHDAQGKASFLRAYLEGEIPSIGRTDTTPGSILFEHAQVAAYGAMYRMLAAGGALTQQEAATAIGCDPQAVPGLVAAGLLETTAKVQERVRITYQSVERFSIERVALSSLAKLLGSTSRRLMKLCRLAGIELLTIPRHMGSGIPFIERRWEADLIALSNANPSRGMTKEARGGEPRVIDALRGYLANLEANGKPLPFRGAQANRRAIASACGFDRSVLYNNPVAVALLEQYSKNSRLAC